MQTQKLHAHKCPQCSHTVWTHPVPPEDCSKEFHTRAHTCPVCGTEEYWKYYGKLEVTHPFKDWNSLPPLSFAKGEHDTEERAAKCNGNCATCQFQFQHTYFDDGIAIGFEDIDIIELMSLDE